MSDLKMFWPLFTFPFSLFILMGFSINRKLLSMLELFHQNNLFWCFVGKILYTWRTIFPSAAVLYSWRLHKCKYNWHIQASFEQSPSPSNAYYVWSTELPMLSDVITKYSKLQVIPYFFRLSKKHTHSNINWVLIETYYYLRCAQTTNECTQVWLHIAD